VIFVRNKCNFSYLLVTRWFINILLVYKTEMREILVTRQVSGRWLQNAGVSREMLTQYCGL